MPLQYKRLQDNKRSASEFAVEIINKNPVTDGIENLRYKLKKEKDITKAIEILAEMKDLQNNITWHKSGDNLVRDGRNAKNPPVIPAESYAIQYLNHVRAAMSLTKDVNLQESLRENSLKKIEDLIKISDISLLEKAVTKENTILAMKLIKNGISHADDKIRLAKDFSNLQDKHYHISTITQVEGVSVVESEIMHLGLSESQKQMFQAIDSLNVSTDKKPMHIELDGKNMDWFNKMHRWEQDQVKKYASVILQENHVIPTQLRSYIPLIRNAYTKVLSIKREKEDIEEILESMHSASLSTATKGNNLDITMGNIAQLRNFAGPESRIHMNALLSPVNVLDADSTDNKLVRQATERMFGVIKTTTPFNFLRKWIKGGGIDLSGAVKALDEIGLVIEKDFPAIGKFLKLGDVEFAQDAIEEVSKLKKSKKKQCLENAIVAMSDILELKMNNYLDRGVENINSRISINMKLITYAARKGILGKELVSLPVINSYCKSGKDRTQTVEIALAIKSLNQALNVNSLKEQTKNLKIILSGDHATTMAGLQGGSMGCYGIKSTTAKDASESVFKEVRKYFTPRTSMSNKFKVNKIKIRTESLKYKAKQISSKIKHFVNGSNAIASQVRIIKKNIAGLINNNKEMEPLIAKKPNVKTRTNKR